MKYKKLLNFFEGEAGEGTGEGTAQAAAGQTEGTTTEGTGETPEDLDAEFDAMIKGKFKEQYNRRFQTAFDQRHKDYKQNQEMVKTLAPMLDMLKAKYGVSELNDLQKAIMDDDSYYEQEAMARGYSVEQLKHIKKLERDNARLEAEHQETIRQQAAREQAEKWGRQEQELRKMVPDLDVRKELENPDFERMLTSGVDMKTAYQVVHMDEIMSGAMNYTAKKAVEKTVKGIQARGQRPDELGLSKQQGDPGKKTVSDMTGDEILDIAKRAMKGEIITL